MALLLLGALLSAIRGAMPVVGFAIIVGTFLIAWLVRRFVKSHLDTWIQTTDDALICKTPSGDKVEIPWGALSHAGTIHTPTGEQLLYCYSTPKDQFLCIPPSFENLTDLYGELAERIELEDITMNAQESPGDALRRSFADSSDDMIDSEKTTEPEAATSTNGEHSE